MSYCIKDPTDEQILRIYARENNTQRGEDNSAQAGPVASALRVLTRNLYLAHDGPKQGRHEVGSDRLAKLLGYPPGNKVIEIQIANLKASGDYVRILEEVQIELGDRASETLQKDVARAKIRSPRIFDAQGVQKILKTPEQVAAFRKIVTAKSIQSALPVERQAELAQKLVEKAATNKKPDGTAAPKEVSGRFLRDETVGLMLQTKAIARKMDDDERAELERGDWEKRAENLMNDMARAGRSMMTNMLSLVKHCEGRPRGVMLTRTGPFTELIDNLNRIIKFEGRLK